MFLCRFILVSPNFKSTIWSVNTFFFQTSL